MGSIQIGTRDLTTTDVGAALLFGIDPIDSTKANALLVDVNGFVFMTPSQGSTMRVNAGLPAPGQVNKNYTGLQALGATATTIPIETVTTGRSYLITDLEFTISGATGQILVQVQMGGINVFTGYVNTTKGLECQFESGPIGVAGQTVTVVVGIASGATIAFNVFGTEQ